MEIASTIYKDTSEDNSVVDDLDKEPGGADTASNNISLDNSIADDLEYKLGGEDYP